MVDSSESWMQKYLFVAAFLLILGILFGLRESGLMSAGFMQAFESARESVTQFPAER